jgi:beta-mannanase
MPLLFVSGAIAQYQHSNPIMPPIDGGYLGAWANDALGRGQVGPIASLEQTLGHKLDIHLTYWQFNDPKKPFVGVATDPAVLDDIAKGRIPLISWGCSNNGTTFQQIADGNYDQQYVVPGAAAVKSLKGRVFIRLSWEFNNRLGDPTATLGNGCFTPANYGKLAAEEAEFIAYFRHVVDVFREQGVDNVTWVWCPEVNEKAMANFPVGDFYPGDRYVDWIAGDSYDKPTASVRGFVAIWTPFWNAFHNYGKPMMIAETGELNNATDAFTQRKFFDDAAAALTPGGIFNPNPSERIAAFVYFDAHSNDVRGHTYDWSVDTPSNPDVGGEKAWAAMAGLPYFKRGTDINCPTAGTPPKVIGSCRLALPETGAYLGILADPELKNDCTDIFKGTSECSIQVREGLAPPPITNLGISRNFALHMSFPDWKALSDLVTSGQPWSEDVDLEGDHENGRVPVLGWRCDNNAPPAGYDSTDQVIAEGDLGDVNAVSCDPLPSRKTGWPYEYCVIHNTATLLAEYPGPVLLRWNYEFNLQQNIDGNNYYCLGWPKKSHFTETKLEQIQSDFKAAWLNVWTIFQQAGASNVMFVWDPGYYFANTYGDPRGFYPSAYPGTVDFIALDTFQRNPGQTFSDNFDQFYSDYSGLDPNTNAPYGKPLMVGANGSMNYADNNPYPNGCPNDKPGCPQGTELQADYLNGLLMDKSKYPALKAYEYFDSIGNIDYVLDSPICIGCNPPLFGQGGLLMMAALGSTPQFNATPQSCSVTVSPTSSTVENNQISDLTINVSSTAYCPWSVGPLPTWITLNAVHSQDQDQKVGPLGDGAVTLHLAPAANGLEPYTVYIGGVPVTITVLYN